MNALVERAERNKINRWHKIMFMSFYSKFSTTNGLETINIKEKLLILVIRTVLMLKIANQILMRQMLASYSLR